MSQVLSDKKNLQENEYYDDNQQISINGFLSKFGKLFVVHRTNNISKASSYLLGLLKCEKNHTNMERMVEQVPEQAYHQYHNFLSESKWDYKLVNDRTALETSDLLEKCKAKSGKPTGFILDESSHLKKGKKSVGVARQYAGVSGKVDNSQVSVYGSLCNEGNVSIIDVRLFLPEQWTQDKARCDKAGIPESEQVFETKPQKALAIIKSNVELGVKFDWIGGDGLYGHNTELTHGLDALGLFYVLDVHKDELFYLEKPVFSIPLKKGNKGRTPKNLKTDKATFRIDNYFGNLSNDQWERVKVRKTTKGWKYVFVHTVAVWHWDGKENNARERTLIITRTQEKNPKIKYSFSNGAIDDYTKEEYAYFQCSRYWVERSFDDAKNELGLSGYQVQKWNAWQHHQSLTMMACLYMLNLKIARKPEYELMSLRDIRIMIIAQLFSDQETVSKLHEQMLIRHKNRKRDIDRYYKNENDS
ncbi:MAG: IS701 family transposase [Paludibacter sp.]|nr:IS701 family transposase [Paludibacter sp.]